MNNKGQVLVFFIISIPLFLMLSALVIDLGVTSYKRNKMDGINKMVIKYGLENIEKENIKEEMIDLLYKNDSQIDTYILKIEDNEITLKINKSVDSVFGKIMGIRIYNIESFYRGHFIDNKIVVEKGNKNG